MQKEKDRYKEVAIKMAHFIQFMESKYRASIVKNAAQTEELEREIGTLKVALNKHGEDDEMFLSFLQNLTQTVTK